MTLKTACPKPAKRIKKARKAIVRTPMKKKKPSAKETTRSMGTKARREFVASLPCAACGVVGYSQNAHLLGNGGKGRKKHHTTIGPLCGPRPNRYSDTTYLGHHALYDKYRIEFDFDFPHFYAEAVAAETEELWQSHRKGP